MSEKEPVDDGNRIIFDGCLITGLISTIIALLIVCGALK